MAYNEKLADRIRIFLSTQTKLRIEEKKMFGGLAFLLNKKMCINVSNDNLMCRFDPILQDEIAERKGFQPMKMKGREYKGYCYVSEEGYKSNKDFDFWINLCLAFNDKAKTSKNKHYR